MHLQRLRCENDIRCDERDAKVFLDLENGCLPSLPVNKCQWCCCQDTRGGCACDNTDVDNVDRKSTLS
jgi:hypothetical protein